MRLSRRCDGLASTVTLILDTCGNVFGDFTPLRWESGFHKSKRDDSLKSFPFTLKNPHNTLARRFALEAKEKESAICCDSE
jgi:hypothetical protein